MSDQDQTSLPVAAVMEASKQMLQLQLYAIFTSPVAGIGPVLAQLEDHLAFQVALERDGILHAAGPMWTEDEQHWEGDGMVVVRASSRADAIAIAQRDPMHQSGARSFTVRPWMINEGSMTIRLRLSGQGFEVL